MKRSFKPKVITAKPDQLMLVPTEIELMKHLLAALPHKSRQNIKSLLSHKQVVVNGKEVSQFNFLLHPGDEIKIRGMREPEDESFQKFSIVFEDEHLIVVDKHSGILSISTPSEKEQTVYFHLRAHVKRVNPLNKLFVVHRLDRETSGLMLFAKSANVQRLLQDNWHDVITERMYVAIAEGVFSEREGIITSFLHENQGSLKMYSDQNPENGKKAVTHYKVLKYNKNFSLMEIHLDTGRKNQIRVHLQEMGHPIVNDRKYGSTTNPIKRLGLHSRVLSFIHPITKEQMRFSTPIPNKFVHLF
ncbi:MAG: RluA family pseudouridine synthase [Prolixibacteraceae bacterium]